MTSEEVYELLTNNPTARAATDFVNEISPLMVILYGCDDCKGYPLRSNSWYRCIKTGKALEGGLTAVGESAGHWRCSGCLKRWTWATDGEKRVFVIGGGDDC